MQNNLEKEKNQLIKSVKSKFDKGYFEKLEEYSKTNYSNNQNCNQQFITNHKGAFYAN